MTETLNRLQGLCKQPGVYLIAAPPTIDAAAFAAQIATRKVQSFRNIANTDLLENGKALWKNCGSILCDLCSFFMPSAGTDTAREYDEALRFIRHIFAEDAKKPVFVLAQLTKAYFDQPVELKGITGNANLVYQADAVLGLHKHDELIRLRCLKPDFRAGTDWTVPEIDCFMCYKPETRTFAECEPYVRDLIFKYQGNEPAEPKKTNRK